MKRRCNIKCNDASNYWCSWTLLTGGPCVLSRHLWTLLLCLGSKFTHTWPGCSEQFARYKRFSLKATTNWCLRVRPSRCLTGSWSLHVSYRIYVQCYRLVSLFFCLWDLRRITFHTEQKYSIYTDVLRLANMRFIQWKNQRFQGRRKYKWQTTDLIERANKMQPRSKIYYSNVS
jgi:hypothetical protein